ncbi:hypothetical protein ACFQ7M_40305 [Streptomyces massasporeus]
MSHPTPLYADPVEFAATRHRIVINLSGGKDGLVAGAIAMDAARQADIADRVWTAHASLGPMEWPAVTVDGVRWPSASELAARHSQALGVPPERHIEDRRSREVDGERVPFDLLTFIAERGEWPWFGRARTCTGPWKTKMVYQAFTPQVRALREETDGPLMFAIVLGMRAEESTERRNREMWRRTTDNSARVVDEWLPAHQVTTEEVWERTISAGLPYHWCYDSYPGARDRGGQSLFMLGLHPGQPPRSTADRRAPAAARRAVRAGRTRPPGAVQPELHHGRGHRAVPSARRPGPWRRG